MLLLARFLSSLYSATRSNESTSICMSILNWGYAVILVLTIAALYFVDAARMLLKAQWRLWNSTNATGKMYASWYHAVSKDMLHWTHLPVALVPGHNDYDCGGIFSGSATLVVQQQQGRGDNGNQTQSGKGPCTCHHIGYSCTYALKRSMLASRPHISSIRSEETRLPYQLTYASTLLLLMLACLV